MKQCLPVFNYIFFCCKYQLSFLLHFKACHLAKCWNRKVYLLHRIYKEKKNKAMSFSVPSCCWLFLRFERQKCSSDNPVSFSHFLLEMALFLLLLWVLSPGPVPCMLPLNHIYFFFVLCHLLLGFDQVTFQMRGRRKSLQENLQAILDQLVVSCIVFLCSMLIPLLMFLQMF